MNKSKIVIITLSLLSIGLISTNIITLNKLLIDKFESAEEADKKTIDEISRIKYFVKDWYSEINTLYKFEEVFLNEIRFENGIYTLTIASDRIRAVYPRGERFFQMECVTYGEFFKENGYTQCRLYYNETGTLIFKLN